MIPVRTVVLLNRSRVQFRRLRTGSAHAGVVHVAAYWHVESVGARIGTIIILGDGHGKAVRRRIDLITGAADNYDFNLAVAGDEMVIGPADRIGGLQPTITGIVGIYGYGRAGPDWVGRIVQIDIDTIVVEPSVAGARQGENSHLCILRWRGSQSQSELRQTMRSPAIRTVFLTCIASAVIR